MLVPDPYLTQMLPSTKLGLYRLVQQVCPAGYPTSNKKIIFKAYKLNIGIETLAIPEFKRVRYQKIYNRKCSKFIKKPQYSKLSEAFGNL